MKFEKKNYENWKLDPIIAVHYKKLFLSLLWDLNNVVLVTNLYGTVFKHFGTNFEF